MFPLCGLGFFVCRAFFGLWGLGFSPCGSPYFSLPLSAKYCDMAMTGGGGAWRGLLVVLAD